MDVLSAIKMMGGSQITEPTSLTNSATTGAASPIPAQELAQINADGAVQSTSGAQGGSFQNLLGDFVGQVSDQQAAANEAMSGLMSGKNVSLHQVMISMEEANISFQMMVEVRNKLLDSYQELMRMQV